MENSLAQNTFEAFICGGNLPIALPIATQVPRACNVPRTEWKVVNILCLNQHTFTATETTAGALLSTFLRFAAAPSGDRRSLSTSTHKANNVVSGGLLAKSRSAKHYEAVNVRDFITSDVFFLGAKVGINTQSTKK